MVLSRCFLKKTHPSKDKKMQDRYASIMKTRRAITAIAQADQTAPFAEVIASDLDSFRGLRVAYATKATRLQIQEVRLDQIEAACPMVRSFFDGSGLLFYTDDIYRKTLAGGAAFHVDFSVSLDKNVAEAFRCFANGKSYSKPEEFYRLLLLLRGRGELSFNFDYFSYLIEEMEHFDAPNNRRPLETLAALKRFDHLTPDALREPPGSPKFLMSQSEGEAAAKTALDGMMKTLNAQELQVERRGIHAILLKTMHLRWQKRASPLDSLVEIVQFSLEVLGKLAKLEIYLAWKFLGCAGTVPKFFAPVLNPGANALKALKGMSWDVAMFRAAEKFAAMQRHDGHIKADFFVPLVASFDEKFKQLVQACPLRAIVMSPATDFVNMIFRDQMPFELALRDVLEGPIAATLNDPRAQSMRQASALSAQRIETAIAKLEDAVRDACTQASSSIGN